MPDLSDRIARLIAVHGPIPVAQFMAEANAAYYAAGDPLGAEGDFTTAPEISQMFGELIGLWAADLALRAGTSDAAWVELGPGRGQAQYLASLFHPDTPNDLAPVGYNESEPQPGLPSSPLAPSPAKTGFRWGVDG